MKIFHFVFSICMCFATYTLLGETKLTNENKLFCKHFSINKTQGLAKMFSKLLYKVQ